MELASQPSQTYPGSFRIPSILSRASSVISKRQSVALNSQTQSQGLRSGLTQNHRQVNLGKHPTAQDSILPAGSVGIVKEDVDPLLVMDVEAELFRPDL